MFIGSVGCGRSREVTRLVGGARRSHGGGYLRLHDVAVVSASSSRGRAQVAPNARTGRGLVVPSRQFGANREHSVTSRTASDQDVSRAINELALRCVRRSWALDADRVEHVGGEVGGRPCRWLRQRCRADDDHRAVEVEDPQGLGLARFVLGVAWNPSSTRSRSGALPASEIGVRPRHRSTFLCGSSWWCSPTCRRGRCVGMLYRRSRRWRCPTGRSRRPSPAAR